MFRSWIIADGPAELSEADDHTSRTFTILGEDTKPLPVTIDLDTVGPMHGGAVKSITGRLHLGNQLFDITGNYHVTDHTGSCHTTDA